MEKLADTCGSASFFDSAAHWEIMHLLGRGEVWPALRRLLTLPVQGRGS